MAGSGYGCVALFAAGLLVPLAGCGAAPPPVAAVAPAVPDSGQMAVERGRLFAETACAGCHAVGRTGASPLRAAPPLREIIARRGPEALADGFADGLVTSHPAMPDFVFRASEIDDLMAWLEALLRPAPPPP